MKPLGLALAAALALAAFGAAGSASAADKPGPFDSKQIDQGKKDAPAVVQAAGMTCQVADAAYEGEGEIKDPADPKVKPAKAKIYEVACQDGQGYVVQAIENQKAKVYDCVTLEGAGQNCRLPENADTKKMLAPLISAAGRQCSVTQDRALGSNAAGDKYFEVACSQGGGYVLKSPASGAPTADDCSRTIGTALECKFTTKAQIDAAASAAATSLLSKSGKKCQLTKSRSIGLLQSGDTAYEVACQDGSGYVLEATSTGDFHTAISCANAGATCQLTDATKAESAESSTYTNLANKGGFPCQVAKYRYIGIENASKSEIVELQCSNRPDGVIAMFPTDNVGQGKFYDCVEAGAMGQSCKLSDASPLYAKYQGQLASKGKNTCKVSNARGVGRTADGAIYVETACADGLPGYVIHESPQGQPVELLTCGQARAAGLACQLPGNAK